MDAPVVTDNLATIQHDSTGVDPSNLFFLSASRVDLSNFPNTTLQKLAPSAASTFLYAVSCFHQMNSENTAILVNCLKKGYVDIKAFFQQWLSNNMNMPNFETACLALAMHVPELCDLIRTIKLPQRQRIINNLLAAASAIQSGNDAQEPLRNRILNDYLDDFENGRYSDNQWSMLQSIFNLIPLKKIKTPKQILLSQTIWKHIRNTNGHILALVLSDNTPGTIKMLSSQMSSQELLPLFKAALTHLKDKKGAKNILESAIQEIEFEHSLAPKPTSWFSRSKQHLLRGMFYGWQGFFMPKKPRYLPIFSLVTSHDGTGTIKRSQHQDKPSPIHLVYQIESLLPLINYRDLQQLSHALDSFEYEPKFHDSSNPREKVDGLFTRLWEKTRTDPTLSIWMNSHRHAFINNRKQLLAQYCQMNDWVALAELLNRSEIGPGKNDFDAIAEAIFATDQAIASIWDNDTQNSLALSHNQQAISSMPTKIYSPQLRLRQNKNARIERVETKLMRDDARISNTPEESSAKNTANSPVGFFKAHRSNQQHATQHDDNFSSLLSLSPDR